MSKLLSSRKNQWAIVVGVVVIILLIILKISLTNNEKSNYIPSYDSYSSISNRDASSIFNNLVITNFKLKPQSRWYDMSCEVENNNSFTIYGYINVGFYSKDGTLICTHLMPIPDVASGEKVICSTIISKDDDLSNYSYVRFSQAALDDK